MVFTPVPTGRPSLRGDGESCQAYREERHDRREHECAKVGFRVSTEVEPGRDEARGQSTRDSHEQLGQRMKPAEVENQCHQERDNSAAQPGEDAHGRDWRPG